MKRFMLLFLVLIVGSMVAACSASTANISKAETGTGYDKPNNAATGVTTTFAKDAPEIHTVVNVANVPDGTTLKGTYTIVDATDAAGNAIKDKQIADIPVTMSSDGSVDFKISGPNGGVWPTGSYKIDIYLNDKLDRTLTFTVQ